MSSSRGRGRGGRGGWTGGPPKGLFAEGVWHCDCTPRKPAVHFEVKKDGPNKGKWFRSCQKAMNDETRCKFFLWDTDAHRREAAALSNNSRTELRHADLTTPSRRQPSPPPPYTVQTGSSEASRKRNRVAADFDDDFGLDQTDDAFNNELQHVMEEVETPSKAVKTSDFATPSTRRKLPWQIEKPSTATHGLQTPQTVGRPSKDPFNTRLTTSSGVHLTPSKHDGDDQQTATPSSSCDTPTPSRFRNVSPEDLVRDVFSLLQESNVRLPNNTDELKSLLSRHAKSAEGLRRGRDVIRTTVKAKDAKITELTYRVNTLEAEIEAEKEMKKHLQWELDAQSDS